MARGHFYKVLLNTNGTALTGASVSVRDTADTVLSDTLFTTEAGGGSLSNPFTSSTGVVEFYLAVPKRVHVQYTPPGGAPTTVVVDVNPSADVLPNAVIDLTTINSTLSGHTTSIATLNTNVGTNTTNIATNASAITTLNTTVGGHTTSIAANASAITATNGNVTTLSTTVAGHTTAIGALTGLSAATPAQSAATGTVGTATAAARGDHRHQSQFQIEGTTLPLRDGGLGTTLVAIKAAVGAVGTVSDSGHRHPRYYSAPSDHGLLGFTDPPKYINSNGSALGNGVIQMALVPVPEGGLIGHIDLILNVAIVGASAGCFVMVLNSAGTVIGASTDQGASGFISAPNPKKIAVTVIGGQSLTVAAGDFVYVGVLANSTTSGPSFVRVAGNNLGSNYGLSAPNFLFCADGTGGRTTVPTSVTLSATTNITGFWAGVSV